MSFQLRCHRCSGWLGEAPVPMELIALFKRARDRERIPPPRHSYRCKCGWLNVFRPIAHADEALELKRT